MNDLNKLLSTSKEENRLYMEGIGGVMKLGIEDRYQIDPDRIKVIYGRPKPLSLDAMKGIISRRERFEEKIGKPIKTNNCLTVTHTPYLNDSGQIIFERYLTDFINWRFSQPCNDESAGMFHGPEDVHHSFFISVYPITNDKKVIIPNRTNARATYGGDFCFTGGYGREKDVSENLWRCETEMFLNGTGKGLIQQAKMIPIDQYGLGDINQADKFIGEGKLLGITTMDPLIGEIGHHIDALVYLKLNSKEVIESANKKYAKEDFRRFVKIEGKNIFGHDPKTLINFANHSRDESSRLAPTQNQLVWLVLANEFGERYLEKIDNLKRY